jgi:YggT family protein
MSNQILIFLLDTVLGLFSLALLLRFYMQLLRTPFYNPLSKFLVAVTNFIVLPVRRIIPAWRGFDLSTLVLAWLTQFIILVGVSTLKGYALDSSLISTFIGFGLLALIELVRMTLYIVMIMLIVQAVLSWINPYSPLAPILDGFTRPILSIFQRYIPPIANVDLSPLFAIILLQLLLMIVENVQQGISVMF